MNDVTCHIKYNGKIIVECRKDTATGLWLMPLTVEAENDFSMPITSDKSDTNEAVHSAYHTTSRAQLAQYHHQSMFSPPQATILKAIKNNQLTYFPGLTQDLLKHLPPATATHKGHMHLQRKGVRSTGNQQQAIKDARLDLRDMNPTQEACTMTDGNLFCYAALADTRDGVIYTDLPGPFLIRSVRNMQYIFVCYAYEPNAILVRPMKSRETTCMIEAYTDIYKYLSDKGFKPKLNVTDNECSRAVQDFIHGQQCDWQLVEPNNHQVNATERAIQTFKNHFIAGLATVDREFPLQLWCYLLQQAELTLNLLRTSRHNPTMSAYQAMEGVYDYNATPLRRQAQRP